MNTIRIIATGACKLGAAAVFVFGFLVGCSALPEPPVRPVLYDFGPAPLPATAPAKALPALALATLDNAGQPDGSSAVHYRLTYADARELRPYQQARWSQPPIQLMRQRLQAHLGQQRAVVGTLGALASVRVDGLPPALLRVELEEFSQVFDSPEHSVGLVRLRATLTRPTPLGESLLAQRLFEAQAPAPSPDAAGGARALAQGADQVAAALAQWLESSGH